MIDKKALQDFIEDQLSKTDCFLVDLNITKNNEITVEIDSATGVDIDYCVELTRAIKEAFSRDDEDYELEVGSAGLTSPFKVIGQYEKNLGNKVVVLTKDGRKLHGVLSSVNEESFTVDVTQKVRVEGQKRPVERIEPLTFGYDDVKSVVYEIEF